MTRARSLSPAARLALAAFGGSDAIDVRGSPHARQGAIAAQDTKPVDGKGTANCKQSVDSYIYIC